MDEGNTEAGNRKLIIVLSVLGIAIVGLMIGVVIVLLNRNGTDEGKISESEWTVQANGRTIDEIIDDYQISIDSAGDDGERADYYEERINFVLSTGEGEKYSDVLLDDALAYDKISQSVGSAMQVANIAQMLGDDELKEKYSILAGERGGGEIDVMEYIESE